MSPSKSAVALCLVGLLCLGAASAQVTTAICPVDPATTALDFAAVATGCGECVLLGGAPLHLPPRGPRRWWLINLHPAALLTRGTSNHRFTQHP